MLHIGFMLHTIARSLGSVPEETLVPQLALLWAVPGMPQVLLLETLLNKTTARRADIERMLRRKLTSDEKYEHDLKGHDDTGAYELCFLVFNLLAVSGFGGGRLSMNSANDGAGTTPRACGAVGATAARRAMCLWLDPAVRRDCGDALGPAASFAAAAWSASDEAERAALLLSGLTEACLDEMSESGASAARYTRQTLRSVVGG